LSQPRAARKRRNSGCSSDSGRRYSYSAKPLGKDAPKRGVVEAGERRDDGEPVEERQIAAQDDQRLEADDDEPGDQANASRTEDAERSNEFAR
jgi:hypothetical protein